MPPRGRGHSDASTHPSSWLSLAGCFPAGPASFSPGWPRIRFSLAALNSAGGSAWGRDATCCGRARITGARRSVQPCPEFWQGFRVFALAAPFSSAVRVDGSWPALADRRVPGTWVSRVPVVHFCFRGNELSGMAAIPSPVSLLPVLCAEIRFSRSPFTHCWNDLGSHGIDGSYWNEQLKPQEDFRQ
jgi:hypothetical protein